MNLSRPFFKHLFLFLSVFVFPACAVAGEVSYSNRLQGSAGSVPGSYRPIAIGENFMVTDPEFPVTAGATFTDDNLENRVSLRYTGAAMNNSLYTIAWDATVEYTITFYQIASSTSLNGTLTITYDPATTFNDIATIRYPGVAGSYFIKVEVTNVDISNLPSSMNFTEDFTLEGEIYANRTYKINTSSYPKDIGARLPYPAPAFEPATIDPQVNNVVEFEWDYFLGAEAYELEWVYMYSEAPGFVYPASGAAWESATHVIVPGNNYRVTLAFEEGYIFYRVRPLTKHYLATDKWIEGAYYDYEEDYFKLSKSHNDKNWVFGAVYAEDGMKKENIAYYDGTLRQRQSVTKNNSDNKAIVQSMYYDHEGRPAISTLPEPDRFSGELKFYAGYNLNGASPFGKSNFDDQLTVNAPDPINGGDGGTYYSAANTQLAGNGFNSYIPEASGYAYVRTLYGIDGLVQKQSGAGPDHAIGSGHETEKYVATPLQEKLDLLFGLEAGDSRYYREYAVKDANGQIAISYENLRGQVVATALAGDAPGQLSGLASAGSAHEINANLNNTNTFYPDQQAWISHTELFVPSPGWYKFNYTLNSGWYTSLCEGGAYDCNYKLRITIFDGCNLPVDDDPSHLSSNNIVHETVDFAFSPSDPTTQSTGDFWVEFTATGTYIIEKKLALDEAAIAAAVAEYRSHIEFYESNKAYNFEQTCVPVSVLGTAENMTAATDLLECEGCSTCVSTPAIVNNCDALYHTLLVDMSPGGQYFDNTPATVTTVTNTWLQDWVWGDGLGSSTTPWTNANYVDMNGNVVHNWDDVRDSWDDDFVTQTIPGTTDPNGNWNFGNTQTGTYPAFVCTTSTHNPFTSLVQFHPEYCHYEWCEKTAESVEFDMSLFSNSTYAWAVAEGYISGGVADITAILDADPFFNSADFSTAGYHLSDYKSAMNTLMTSGYPSSASMWSYALSITSCTSCDENWQVFVATYVAEKNRLMEEFKLKDFGCSYLNDDPAKDGIADCTVSTPGDYLETYTNVSGGKACGFKIRVAKPAPYVVPSGPVSHPFADVITEFNTNSICEKVATATFTISGVTASSASLAVNSVNITGSVPCASFTTAQLAAAIITAVNTSTVTPVYYASGSGATITIYATPGTGNTVNTYAVTGTGFTMTATASMSGGVNDGDCDPTPDYKNCFCELMDQIVQNGIDKGDLSGTPITTEMNDYIAAGINSGYADQGVGITSSDVALWRTNCADSYEDDNYPTQSPETWSALTETYTTTVPLALRCYDPASTCAQDFADLINFYANAIYQEALDTALAGFERRLRAHCLGQAYVNESGMTVQPVFSEDLQMSFEEKEYHYTLYYYDLAGNLTRTVPPESVNYFDLDATIGTALTYVFADDCSQLSFASSATLQEVIDGCRAAHYDGILAPSSGTCYSALTDYYRVVDEDAIRRQPNTNTESQMTGDYHELVTNYKYNTLNQLIESRVPDNDGPTTYLYDALGRLRASQDARQAAAASPRYSYVTYDQLGRIFQSGELVPASGANVATYIASETPSSGVFFPGNLVTAYPASVRQQVNWVFYDDNLSITGLTFSSGVNYDRNRVTHRLYQTTYNGSSVAIQGGAYDYGTHYAYDVHGNVKELVQDNPTLTSTFAAQRFKKIVYTYDLISGNVKTVSVQPGEADQVFYKYRYDADSRLIEAFSSTNGVQYSRDAEYFYYLHGPLARVEIGEKKVQGLDYAYTIMGWIKGMNSNTLDNTRDPGNDSKYGEAPGAGSYRTAAPNLHQYVATDAASYSLHYFTGDYTPIEAQTSASDFIADMSTIAGAAAYGPDLFNGNISRMVTTLTDIDPLNAVTDGTPLPQLMCYEYDQLNRIKAARAYSSMNFALNYWTVGTMAAAGNYYNSFTYDASGNILTQQRNGLAAVEQMEDNLTYNYKTRANGNITSHRTNQLQQVAEDASLADCSYGDDINKGQASDNYVYDEIGNLIIDKQEYIYGSNNPAVAGIEWTAFGKIKSITKDNTTGKFTDCNGNNTQDGGEATLVLQDLVFEYNSYGQRICKIVKPHNPAGGVLPQADWIYTYYLRDAQGNVLETYERKQTVGIDLFAVKEQHLDGSSRVGMIQTNLDLLSASAPGDAIVNVAGERVYEISNHLGNVLTTMSDQRVAVDVGANGTVDYFEADIISATDYAAFGAPLAGRSFSAPSYRYGFNGKENDLETGTQDYGMRIYNPTLGKFLSIDPITSNYPELTPYQFASNRPVDGVDLDGLEWSQHINPTGEIFKYGAPAQPNIKHDNGFLDSYPTRQATDEDRKAKGRWAVKATFAQPLLPEASAAYLHYLSNTGTSINFDLGKYLSEDESGQTMLVNCIDIAKDGARRLLQVEGGISMTSSPLVGGDIFSDYFPYAATENWQKAIGGFSFWMSASVTSYVSNGEITYTMLLTIHAEDMYNFNPGAVDIATGTPDDENGRFQLCGLAKQFMQYGTYTTTVIWTDPQIENPAPLPQMTPTTTGPVNYTWSVPSGTTPTTPTTPPTSTGTSAGAVIVPQ